MLEIIAFYSLRCYITLRYGILRFVMLRLGERRSVTRSFFLRNAVDVTLGALKTQRMFIAITLFEK